MKLVELTNGSQLEGELIEEDDKTMTLKLEYGQIILDKKHIKSCVDFYDCRQVQVGQFVKTPRGTYLKIDNEFFVLVTNNPMAAPSVKKISDGESVSFEEVFPEYEAGK